MPTFKKSISNELPVVKKNFSLGKAGLIIGALLLSLGVTFNDSQAFIGSNSNSSGNSQLGSKVINNILLSSKIKLGGSMKLAQYDNHYSHSSHSSHSSHYSSSY